MSNHPSENTKGRLLRRALAGILTLALMLGLLPASVFTAHAASWADSYVQTLVDWGVMRGDIGGNMAPNRSITRAEFVTMMNRAYGYKKLGGHPFTDVRVRDWYNEDIDIAYNIGYFKGTSDTTASPNASLTREQAAVLLARNMMLQETVGETLGFSDTRRLSDWSRGLVGAAAANGIIGGYEDGSFQPMRNITRGEVAAMLVRAIGTPIQEAGDHALGNVYGNVTVNTSGVKLRDGVIAGNLYLTGGIDLGDVLLENVTVLGEIIVSGGGESNSSQSSIVLRNVVADKMVVDSISSQFVTIRAEGNTDIPTTTVRTNAYVDDSSLPGYGLSFIELDGEEGALYQLAGNIKEVINKTPGSSLQVVQGVADKVTVDEKATGSNVLVDGDAQVGDLNLDTGTEVTGSGDIKNLNVGSAGSTVEQLPDQIVIRPGIDADIGGSNMNSSQAAESSADPKLLAGYPAVRKIAPQSAELVFRVNKPGTIYWAVSSVADGSVSEADLLEPPVYGNKVLASGNITATAANTDYTASVSKLTSAGSYYVTAMLVDGRDEHSPIKVTSFTTPDNSVPAFADGYPVMTLVTTEVAQVTVMTTKSCLLYYALLPKGAKAPTEAEFKSAAIPGNLGYGSQSVTKNVTIPINVNSVPLEEKTDYVLYLWLVDHDGVQKSKVVSLPFTTLDETPPVVTDAKQLFSNTTPTADSLQVEYTIDEPADFVWAIVKEGDHMNHQFLPWKDEVTEPGDSDRSTLEFADEASLLSAKVQLASGAGALLSGSSNKSPLTVRDAKLLFENAKTSSFVLYYMADDNATNTGNLSAQIKALRVRTKDETPPDVSLRFSSDGAEVTENPQADADVRILFTEQVKGGNTPTNQNKHVLLKLYQDVLDAEEKLEDAENDEDRNAATNEINKAKNDMAKALDTYIEFHQAAFPATKKLTPLKEGDTPSPTGSWINWRNAQITMPSDGSGNLEILLPGVRADENGNVDRAGAAIQMEGGVTYYFRFRDIYDLAYPTGNALVQGKNDPCYRQFTTSFAKIKVTETESWEINLGVGDGDRKRIISFLAEPFGQEQVGDNVYWDMLIWSNTSMNFTLYSRPKGGGNDEWGPVGGATGITVTPGDGYVFAGLRQRIDKPASGSPDYQQLKAFQDTEYVIYINSLEGNTTASTWNYPDLQVRVSFVAGTRDKLSTPNLVNGTQTNYDSALADGLACVEQDSPRYIKHPVQLTDAPTIKTAAVDVKDTNATFTMTLNSDGYVYYLLLPMTDVKITNGTDTVNLDPSVPLKEEDIQKISNFNMLPYPPEATAAPNQLLLPKSVPELQGSGKTTTYTGGVAVNRPNVDEVTNGKVADQYPQSRVPASGGTSFQFTVDKLKPNSVYYVFMVTRSSTSIPSDNPVCWRITTQEPIRPIIQVNRHIDSKTDGVRVSVDKTTDLTYVLTKQGEEGSLISAGFTNAADTTKWYSTTTATKWTVTGKTFRYTEADGTVYSFSYEGASGDDEAALLSSLSNMTVLQAMTTECQRGSRYYGSVFDVFADAGRKEQYAYEIEQSAYSDLIAERNGERTCSGSANDIDFSGLKAGFYTFLSVGRAAEGEGSGLAFRAYTPIRVTTSTTPKVIGTYANITVGSDLKLSGTVGISFSEQLYFIDTNNQMQQDAYVVDTCGTHGSNMVSNDKTYALGDVLRVSQSAGTATIKDLVSSHANTYKKAPQDIMVEISGLRANDVIIYTFDVGLCNVSKVNHDVQLTVRLKVVATYVDEQDPQKNTYSVVIDNVIPAEWDGTK